MFSEYGKYSETAKQQYNWALIRTTQFTMAVAVEKDKIGQKLAQMIRNDLHLISAESKKKNPNIKEVNWCKGLLLKLKMNLLMSSGC